MSAALPRSWLFTPGSRPERFAKAASTAAQALILDLEDAVAPQSKAEARKQVCAFLSDRGGARQSIAVRINPLGQATGLEDLAALAQLGSGPDYIVVPKVEQAGDLVLAARVLDHAGSAARLMALIESGRGVARLAEVAEASARLAALMFGAADYAADLGQQVGAFRPDFARAAVVNAAASGGVAAIDSPFFAIDRNDDLHAECAEARSFGFFGKAAIHPAQLGTINAAFAPTAAELELASRIVGASVDGVGVLDGKMVDAAMVRWARRIAEADASSMQ